jgi:penicillin-binding protein 1B
MRVVIRRGKGLFALFRPVGLTLLSLFAIGAIAGVSVFTFYYVRFSRLIDERLRGPVFPNVSQVYAAPEVLRLGQQASPDNVAAYLRRAGYTEENDNPRGWFQRIPGGIRIVPGPDSYFASETADLYFADGTLNSIVADRDLFARSEYSLEPLLVTNLFDSSREKRRLVAFEDLPSNLVNAILAIEDRRFFQHSGVDIPRVVMAAYVDLTSGEIRQGASTLTMQLSRLLFLTPERTWKRKLAETMVTFQLERRLSKRLIFEYYTNKVYLGQRGSFGISGFGEASQAYFNKDVSSLTLSEAAFLAGIVRGPNLYSPYRNPEAALRRRNQVLNAMVETGAITPQQQAEAAASPIEVAPSYTVASEAPYFVDMVKDQLLDKYSEEDLVSRSFRIYTTLDLRLQRAAAEAMRVGLEEVDERLEAMRRPRGKAGDPEQEAPERVEAALIVLDPHTGAVKALIGGRDYGRSQLNRILARRQPGSAFKPFVYAAALNTGIQRPVGPPWTPISKINDEPTTFVYEGGRFYQPANYHDEYHGPVTLRYALARSLNVSTVKVAQMVGYDRVVDLARAAGMNLDIQPTPAVALGSYEVTPLEVAGAYTVFSNEGVRMDPYLVGMVRDRNGTVLEQKKPEGVPVLDPRVAFLVTDLMQGVIRRGTGVGVRARGFTAPAAGKTGTSHDGWFAGYTSNLLAIVWVGYDSNAELPLSGAASALPIWTEFMKRAAEIPQYTKMLTPVPPPGVVQVTIDSDTGELATPHCPRTETNYFVDGTQPGEYCRLHSVPSLIRRIPIIGAIAGAIAPQVTEPETTTSAPAAVAAPVMGAAAPTPDSMPAPEAVEPPEPPREKKRGFFGRIFGIFTGGDSDEDDSNQQ